MPPKPKAARHRSALSNGTTLFLGAVDGRSETGRVFADLVSDLTAERGGVEALSVTQRMAIRQYATLAMLREQLTSDMASGTPVEPQTVMQLGNDMARQVRQMGPVKPAAKRNLDDWIAEKRKGRA